MVKKLILLGILALCLLAPASAILQDYRYDDTTKSAVVTDWLGLSKVATVQLVDNTDTCLTDCYAILKITPDKELKGMDLKFDFTNFAGKSKTIAYKTYVQVKEDYTAQTSYETTCKQYNNKTKTIEDVKCTQQKEVTRQRDVWKETDITTYDYTEPTYIKIEGKKKAYERIDWLPTFHNLQIKEMAWWNAGWSYKQPITISSTNTISTGYVYGLNVTYDAHMKAGFDDLRFINGSENTELPYFIGNQINSSWAYVYVLMDSQITSTNQTIYMYYGNAGASTTSNGTTTFTTLFDHFDNGTTLDLAKWTEINVAGATVSNSIMNLTGTGVFGSALASDSDWAAPNTLTFNAKWSTAKPWVGWYTGQGAGESIAITKPNAVGEDAGGLENIVLLGSDNANFAYAYSNDSILGNWHTHDIMRNTTDTFFALDNVWRYTSTKDTANNRNIRFWTNNNFPLLVDWVGIRPYSAYWQNTTATFGAELSAAGLTVTQNAPVNLIVFNDTTTINFNFTAVSSTDLSFLCDLYIDGILEGTEPATANNTLTNFNVAGISYGNHNWLVNCTDTTMSTNSTTRTFSIVDATLPVVTLNYPNGVYPTNSSSFNFNCSATDNIGLANSTLYWDYAGWASNGTETITGLSNTSVFNRTMDFWVTNPITWNCEVCDNSSNCAFAASNYSITAFVMQVTAGACPGGWTAAQNYTIVDESNITWPINDTAAINIQYGNSTDTSIDTYNISLANASSFNICVIPSLAPYYVGYGEIQLTDPSYASRRHYLFVNSTLTNTTEYLTEYMLNSSYSTTFQFTFTDSALSNYIGYYAKLLQWYPALNMYNELDMGVTDILGQTITHLRLYDTDYRIALYYSNGTLIKLTDPAVRFSCTSTPCSYTVKVDAAAQSQLSEVYGVVQSLSFNNTTSMFNYVWSDPSAKTTSMNLLVSKAMADGDVNICNTTVAGATGSVSCNATGYTGLLFANVYRSVNGTLNIQATDTEDVTTSVFKGAIGLFIGLIMFIAIMLIGLAVSPLAAMIMSIVGLVPAYVLGVIPVAVMMAIAAISVLLMHVFKRVS
jgi:hypothetical protein